MPLFAYSAVDAQGKTHQGTIEANTPDEAAAAIKKKGQFPTNISETAAAPGGAENQPARDSPSSSPWEAEVEAPARCPQKS